MHQRALAKLTLSLHAVGVRADGMHLIDAEMVTIDFADVLTFSDGDGLDIVGREAPDDETNTVRRALAAVRRSAHVRLEKHIPAGAGLGGGSADAEDTEKGQRERHHPRAIVQRQPPRRRPPE